MNDDMLASDFPLHNFLLNEMQEVNYRVIKTD